MVAVPILFVTAKSIYKSLSTCCFDINMDARTFQESHSVVAHPPCRAWGRLKHFAKPRVDEKELAVFSINLIRRNGGVLEHPAGSSLFKHMGIKLDGSTDQYGGYVLSIDQFWFGHRAQKRTYLYICGCEPGSIPSYVLNFNAVTHTISTSSKRTGKKECNRSEREATPLKLAEWLIKIALICERNKKV